jgi:Rrf2 family protein
MAVRALSSRGRFTDPMPTNSRFAIAVHTLAVLGYLQRHGVDRVSSQMVAQSVNTNAVVIRNLLRSLKKAGLIQSKEGRSGGVSLARSPSKISLIEIFTAVETSTLLCLNKKPEFKPCPVSRGMKHVLPPIFQEVDLAVARTLRGKTLKDIVDQISESDPG